MRKITLIAIVLTIVFIGIAKELSETEIKQLKDNWQRVDVDENSITYKNDLGEYLVIPTAKEIDVIQYTKTGEKVTADTTYKSIKQSSVVIGDKLENYIVAASDSTWKKDKDGNTVLLTLEPKIDKQ